MYSLGQVIQFEPAQVFYIVYLVHATGVVLLTLFSHIYMHIHNTYNTCIYIIYVKRKAKMLGMGVQTMQFAMTLCFELAIAVLGGNYYFKSELINNQKASRG